MSQELVEESLLAKAIEQIEAEPDSAEAHTQLAISYVQLGRLDEARNHARFAMANASATWEYLEQLGFLLFELGEFQFAYGALFQASQNGKLSAESYRMLAALFRRNNEPENERRCIEVSARLEAILGPEQTNPDLPKVLRIRSVEKSYYGIKTDRETNLRYCWLKGGHFSDTHLLDDDNLNLYTAASCGENLQRNSGLPEFDLFINAVSCPDLDPIGLAHVEAFVDKYPHVPVINPPQKVRLTTRLKNAERLANLPNVKMPRTMLFDLDGLADEVANKIEKSGFKYPLIVRHRGSQTGKTMSKIDSRDALISWISDQPSGTTIYVIAYIDCRGSDGQFRKLRAFFIDGRFFPVANLTCDQWQIHSGDRYRVMSSSPESQQQEEQYLQCPEEYLGAKAFAGLHMIRDTIDLDFFGIDFTLDERGDVTVFEANAAMRHNFDHADNFPYTRPYLETISNEFESMVLKRANAGHKDRDND